MSGLNDKLLEIKRQKDTYILPENIKKDITVYGVTGTLEAGSSGGDVKLFDTVEHMQEDENPQEGDLAVVYREELADVTAESEFDSCIFPNEVVLDEAFTSDIYGSFRAVDSSSGYFDGMIELSSSRFRFNGYSESGEIQVEYESEDGITYTRTDGGDELQEFGVIIKWEDSGEEFNSIIGNFMKIGGNYFDGLYEYKNVQDYNQIKYIDEVSFENNTLTYSYNKYLDITPYKNVIQEQAEAFFEDENQLTLVKDVDNIIIYLSKTTEGNNARSDVFLYDGVLYVGLLSNISSLQNFIVRKIVINSNGTIVSSTDLTYQSLDNDRSYVDTISNTTGYILITSLDCHSLQTSIYGITSSGGWSSKFENPDYKLVYKYILSKNQLNATEDYVYEKTFYGKNGVENGILQNGLITNDNIKNVYVELSNMFHNGLVVANGIKFAGLTTTELPFNIDTSNVLDMSQMFSNCTNLTTIPLLNTSNVTNMSQMFSGCSSLTSIPQLDTSNANTTSSMFRGCSSITSIPLLNTSNVTDMGYMFSNCSALTTIPQLDTSNVTIMCEIFRNCKGLTSIPQLNTGNVINMQGMFQICTGLTTIPLLNTSNVTNMKSMFGGCSGLTSIPLLDTSKVTNMNSMLVGCTNLTSIPQFDTSSVTDMSYMVQNCTGLVTLPALNTSKVTTMNYMFPNCPNLSNESLNNIMQMCINSAITSSSYKTLSIIGLTRTQVQTCTTLSNYNALINAGWTTGY